MSQATAGDQNQLDHCSLARLGLYFLLTLVGLGITFSLAAGDKQSAARDLPQDYVAAKAWLDGDFAYQPLDYLYARYGFPPQSPDVMVRYNPHPPAAILLSVPFALLDYNSAIRWLVWSQLLSVAATWTLSYWAFRPRVPGWLWAIAGGAFGLWAPVWQGVAWGQPVGFLALAIVASWRLAAVKRPLGFGGLVGATVLVRPFTGAVATAAGGWTIRQLAGTAAAMVIAGSLPFAFLRVWPWEWYRCASYAGGYIAGSGSIPGLFHISPIPAMVLLTFALFVLFVLRRRGLDLDGTAAAGLVVALLLYPLAWFQYDTCLIPVVAWVVARITATENRTAFWAIFAYLAMRTIPDLMPTTSGGLLNTLALYKNELQIFARAILLGAVIAVIPRASEPSAVHDRSPP